VVVVRHELPDGYSDDVVAALREQGVPQRAIVLMRAATSSAAAVRQLELGAFQVQRDPVRADLLTQMMAQLRDHAGGERLLQDGASATLQFAGATFHVLERRLIRGRREVILTPREANLLQLLHDSHGQVVSYERLYSDVLERPFRGETSNMRVLFGLLGDSFAGIGVSLREHVEVIPKSGYRVAPQA
jgi:two-component system KDP operon response regulator KdpE